MADVLPALRDHLVALDLVRRPRVAGPRPPLWLEPENGVPAPGEGEAPETGDPVLGAFLTGGIAAGAGQGYSRRQVVDVWLRARVAPALKAVEEQLTAELAPAPYGPRYAWDMAGVFVLESRAWRPLQLLRSDQQGYVFTVAYLFETYAA